MKDTIKATGEVTVSVNGEVVRKVSNMVVTAGLEWLAVRATGVADDIMSHMAIGSGATAVAIGDTALQTEIARNALNGGAPVVSGAVMTFECTWAPDDPDITAPDVTTIREAGIFNAAAAGTMLAKTTFAAVTKTVADSMTISWVITLG